MTDREPRDHRPIEHGPIEHGPIEHRPIEHRPIEHRPIEHRPIEHRPIEHRPIEHGPIEHRQVTAVADAAAPGELIHDGDRPGLRFVRDYPHPRDRVWRALTESDQLRHWMPCDIVGERAPGAAITLPFWPGHVAKYDIEEPVLTGRIELWDPPRRFGWTWGGDLQVFELVAVEGGTRLVFTTWPEDPDPAGIVSSAGGYHLCLAELTVLLDTGTAPPMTEVDEVAFRWSAEYGRLQG